MTRRLLTPGRSACKVVLFVIVASLACAGGIVACAAILGVDRLVGGGPALH